MTNKIEEVIQEHENKNIYFSNKPSSIDDGKQEPPTEPESVQLQPETRVSLLTANKS